MFQLLVKKVTIILYLIVTHSQTQCARTKDIYCHDKELMGSMLAYVSMKFKTITETRIFDDTPGGLEYTAKYCVHNGKDKDNLLGFAQSQLRCLCVFIPDDTSSWDVVVRDVGKENICIVYTTITTRQGILYENNVHLFCRNTASPGMGLDLEAVQECAKQNNLEYIDSIEDWYNAEDGKCKPDESFPFELQPEIGYIPTFPLPGTPGDNVNITHDINQTSSHNSQVTGSVCLLQIFYGKMFQVPHLKSCQIDNVNDADLLSWSCVIEEENYKVKSQIVPMQDPCPKKSSDFQKIFFVWVNTKVNYFLLLFCAFMMIFFLVKWNQLFVKSSKRLYMHLFVISHTTWLLWHVQESLDNDLKWREKLPYICLFTNTLHYLAITESLYLSTSNAIIRLRATLSPLYKYQVQLLSGRVYRGLAISSGLIIGLVCSSLYIAAVLVYEDEDAGLVKTCQFSTISNDKRLVFLLVAKVVGIVFVYLLPSCILIICNTAHLIVIRRNKTSGMIIRTHTHKPANYYRRKLTANINFLLLSSLVLVFFLPQPMFDLQLVARSYIGASSGNIREDYISEGVLSSLTIVAFFFNAITCMRFAPQ